MNEPDRSPSALRDRITGKVKQAAGAVLGDEDLTREGRIHEQRADATEQAGELAADAAKREEQADLELRKRNLIAAEDELALEREAQAHQDRLRVEADAAERDIESRRAARELAVEVDQVSARRAIALDEEQAVQERGRAAREVAAIDAEAARARTAAEALDRAAGSTEGTE